MWDTIEHFFWHVLLRRCAACHKKYASNPAFESCWDPGCGFHQVLVTHVMAKQRAQ